MLSAQPPHEHGKYRQRKRLTLAATVVVALLFGGEVRGEIAGRYVGPKISVELIAAPSAEYSGEIRMGEQRFALHATTVDATHVAGSFDAAGNHFDFSATIVADQLTLTSGGATYQATRAAPANPLADGGRAPNIASSNDAPPGNRAFAVVLSNAAGKSLAGEKADAKSIKDAIIATFGDLQQMFDHSVDFQNPFEDGRDHHSALASFTCTDHGTAMRGIASFKQQSQGVSVGIVYCRADASPADWKALTDATSVPPDAANGPTIALHDYVFPDGTGSVGLADGWSSTSPTASDVVLLSGPADQHVLMGGCWLVNSSQSLIVKTYRGNVERARQMHMQPPPAPTVLMAELAPPLDALKELLPQINQMNRRQGSNVSTSDIQVIAQQDCPPLNPQGKAVRACYTYIRTKDGQQSLRRSVVQLESAPLGQGEWMLSWAVELAAPDETFDRDQPAMAAMANSLKINANRINQVVQGKMQAQATAFQDAQRRRAESYEDQHRQQMAGYDAHNKQWRQDMNEKGRRNADFVEMIRGYRTVVDTRTGEATSADYYNVDGIVSALNSNDPGRYVEVPLRDELYPKR